MSWYVEQVLMSDNIFDEKDYENDLFCDKLSIEIMIERLYKKNLITNREYVVVNLVRNGFSFRYIGILIKMDRRTVITLFKNVCEKLAFYLGDYFTNQGYIEYLSMKYHLLDDEINTLLNIVEKTKEDINEKTANTLYS